MLKNLKRASQRSQRQSKLPANAKKPALLMSFKPTQVVTLVWNELGGSCLHLARVKLRHVVRLEVWSGQKNAPLAILIAVPSPRGLHLPRTRWSVRPVPLARPKNVRTNPTDARGLCLRRSFASRAPVLEAAPRPPGHLDFATNVAF